MALTVAIVGSGPSGFYTADALLRLSKDCEVAIIERLPTPYGLIRGGVAPDHQTTKNVSRNFEKTARKDRVRYYGNIEIGRDLSLSELRDLFDAVVLATGAPLDRQLGIPGEDKAGVVGSAAFVGWYNGHPDFRDLVPPLDRGDVVVIGNGNVALDIARIISKTPDELATSDIAKHAAQSLSSASVENIYVVGRRGPVEAKFTNVELREMEDLADCNVIVDLDQLPADTETAATDRDARLAEKNIGTLRTLAEKQADNASKRTHFMFFAAPVEILGESDVTGIRFERTKVDSDGRASGTGETFDIDCGLVIPAIGYRSAPIPEAPFDEKAGLINNEDGRVDDGLYVVGWIKRGPTGVIATNRPDGRGVAERIVNEIAAQDRTGCQGLEKLLTERNKKWVNFDSWKRIEAAEIANAKGGAPREKFVTVEDMLSAAE